MSVTDRSKLEKELIWRWLTYPYNIYCFLDTLEDKELVIFGLLPDSADHPRKLIQEYIKFKINNNQIPKEFILELLLDGVN